MMYPFYHPTSIVVVDNDQRLLNGFSLYLGCDMPCHTFTRPEQALQYIQAVAHQRPSFDELFSSSSTEGVDVQSLQRGDRMIAFRASKVAGVLQDRQRFAQVSVAIVDYGMPSMTGIEFCRQLQDLPLKKIMLTGRATYEIAVDAFNEGLIDCFLLKYHHDVSTVIREEIWVRQQEYFDELTGSVRFAMSLVPAAVLKDEVFQNTFQRLCVEHAIVEYYMTTYPNGLLMIRADGSWMVMLVYDQSLFEAHYERVRDNEGPPELLMRLRCRDTLAFFPTPSGYYEPSVAKVWQRYVIPAKKIVGKTVWHYGLLEDSSLNPLGFEDYISYAEYCARRESPIQEP